MHVVSKRLTTLVRTDAALKPEAGQLGRVGHAMVVHTLLHGMFCSAELAQERHAERNIHKELPPSFKHRASAGNAHPLSPILLGFCCR